MTDTTRKDDGDWLGYGVYADTLWQRIERSLANDLINGELGDDPMVIGIFGEWGAGKSHLLKLIERKAKVSLSEQKKKHESDAGFELTVPVWFQPWKYEHEEHLHVPMIIHVLNALKDALKQEATVVDTVVNTSLAVIDTGKKAAPIVKKTIEIASSAYPVIQKILKSMTVFGCNVDLPDEVGEWLETAADGVSDIELSKDAKAKVSAVDAAVKHTIDGSYFYRIHELLGALTRPQQYKHRKDLFKDAKLTPNTRINFVVFVDDLDRCLPEKAVQTLEMIKTIFNVDSFAFVLALDDEVIERGIAHRYKDYALVDKKQQMPITGFEYLEKIVHLPFRLPQLTKTQAQNFIKFEEKRIVGDKQTWFTVQPLAKYDGIFSHDGSLKHDGSLTHSKSLDSQETQPMVASVLTGLFLASFEAYVPRKMVRVIELMHQIAHITSERGKPLAAPHSNIDEVAPEVAGGRDIRVVFTLLMLQLFQPELFRLLRRKEAAFPTLLAAFASDLGGLSGNEISEIDLWTWATFRKQGDVRSKVSNASEALARIATETQSIYNAQQIRLPVVIKLVEHLQIQRHVFNPLKLINALAKSLGESAKAVQISEYYSLLGEQVVAPISGHASMNLEPATMGIATFDRSNDIQSLVDAITERDTGGQANLAGRLELPALLEGKKLSRESCQKLYEALKSWLTSDPIDGKAAHLLQGLSHISPWVDWHLGGKDLWALVSNEIETDTDQLGRLIKLAPALSRMKNAFWFNDSKTLDIVRAVLLKYLSSNGLKPEYRARTGDALGMIGDPRFEGKYALPKRIDGDAPEAPAGFILCNPVKYVFGDEGKTRTQTKPFYISRYLVTVAQYAAFVKADGYKDQTLWESSHKNAWLWRMGEFESSTIIENKSHQEWLTRRPKELRHEPMDWLEQQVNPNRPVNGVTWFEATVYAVWLQQQLQARTLGKPDEDLWGTLKDTGYSLRLPTEGEWERAARAGGTGKFPWGDDEAGIDQRANVATKIGHATTVGSYPPNTLGLYDMTGNVWQWQANLSTVPYENKLITKETELPIGKDFDSSACPSLRGGSWADPIYYGQSSFRGRLQPSDWHSSFGFRLSLSLADFES